LTFNFATLQSSEDPEIVANAENEEQNREEEDEEEEESDEENEEGERKMVEKVNKFKVSFEFTNY